MAIWLYIEHNMHTHMHAHTHTHTHTHCIKKGITYNIVIFINITCIAIVLLLHAQILGTVEHSPSSWPRLRDLAQLLYKSLATCIDQQPGATGEAAVNVHSYTACLREVQYCTCYVLLPRLVTNDVTYGH